MIQALATANVLLLVSNFYFIADPGRQLLSTLGKLPTAWGAFFGAVLGLCGVAWTAKKGFENLIAAQTHRAQIELSAREHQHYLNDQSERLKHSRTAKVLASALMAELGELATLIYERQNHLISLKSIIETSKSEATKSMLEVDLLPWNIPIWDESIKSIGLLGPSLAGDVARIYSKASNSRESKKIEAKNYMFALAIYNGIIQSNNDWVADIVIVNARLSAFISDREDTVSLYNSPRHKAERDAAAAKWG